VPSLPRIRRRTMSDASTVFFLASAIYAAPYMGETVGIIASLICLGIGWYCLWKEKNK